MMPNKLFEGTDCSNQPLALSCLVADYTHQPLHDTKGAQTKVHNDIEIAIYRHLKYTLRTIYKCKFLDFCPCGLGEVVKAALLCHIWSKSWRNRLKGDHFKVWRNCPWARRESMFLTSGQDYTKKKLFISILGFVSKKGIQAGDGSGSKWNMQTADLSEDLRTHGICHIHVPRVCSTQGPKSLIFKFKKSVETYLLDTVTVEGHFDVLHL